MASCKKRLPDDLPEGVDTPTDPIEAALFWLKSSINEVFITSKTWRKMAGENADILERTLLKPSDTFTALFFSQTDVRAALDRTLCKLYPQDTKGMKPQPQDEQRFVTTRQVPTVDLSLSLQEAAAILAEKTTKE